MKSDTPIRFTLGTAERLKLRKEIETLFRTGEAFSVFPLRIVFTAIPSLQPITKMGVSVPKKKWKHATHRNHIKRLIKEAWRTQKHLLQPILSENKIALHLFFIYLPKEALDFATTQKAILKTITQLQQKFKLLKNT